MNYTKKSILEKITRDFGGQLQELPRKRKKRAKALFSNGLKDLQHWQLALLLENVRKETKVIGLPNGFGKGLVQFVNQDVLWASTDCFPGHSKAKQELKTHHCEHCGREMQPCPGKLHATGERSYVGLFPCACKHPIMTDSGVVYPGDEEHDILLETKNYGINDLLTPEK